MGPNQPPRRTKGSKCPLWKKDVSEVCHTCEWYVNLKGVHPQTGAPLDQWGCAIPWLVIVGIETKQASHETGAAVESFRNEMVKLNRPSLVKELLNGSN